MPQWAVVLLFSLIVLAAHFLEGITGFGSTALSVPFLAVLLGIDVAKPVMMLYTLVLCAYILPRNLRHIAWKRYARIMAALLLGLPLGVLLYNRLPYQGETYEALLHALSRMDADEQARLLKYIRFTQAE